MPTNDYIKFLGTAGARFAVARQLRSSAGTLIKIGDNQIVLDPGPGTLVKFAASKPRIDISKLDAIILSHAHIDHSNDVNILIDGMTDGGIKKRGTLFAPAECFSGDNAVVLRYLRGFLQDCVCLEESSHYSAGSFSFTTSVRHRHGVETYGLTFDHNDQKVSFLVDTKYFPELIKCYQDSDLLIINVVLTDSHPRINHLSLTDVREILLQISPKRAVLTHFGMTMLAAKPWEIARQLTRDLGLQVEAAYDGMMLPLDG